MSFTPVFSPTFTPDFPSFPTGPLGARLDLSLAGVWTDATAYVNQGSAGGTAFTIGRGRPDGSPQASPSTCAFQVDNGATASYRFSPHNVLGPWYGLIGRNTPVRVHIPAATARLRLADDNASWVSCPPVAPLLITGDLEARIDLRIDNWAASVLAQRWTTTSGGWSWAWTLDLGGTLTWWWTTDGSTIQTATSTVPLPWPGGRISLKVTFTAATGQVNYYYATSIAGTYTKLGATTRVQGASSIFAGTGYLQLGYGAYFAALTGFQGTFDLAPGIAWAPLAYNGFQGSIYEFRLYNGIGGTLVANPVFTGQGDGVTGFGDGLGNTWTLAGTAAISSRDYRFHGEVAEWPPKADVTGKTVYTSVQANGLLRRLQQRNAPLGSALTRAWQRKTGRFAPVAYWPCEDGNLGAAVKTGLASATTSTPGQIASGLPQGSPMSLTGKQTQFASNSSFVCSLSIPVPMGGTWTGHIPPYTQPDSPGNVVRCLLEVPSGGDTDLVIMARLFTRGTVAQFDLQYGVANSGSLQVTGYDNNGNQLFASGFINFAAAGFPLDGLPVMCEMALATAGSLVSWHCNILPVGSTAQVGLSGTISGTVGNATGLVISPTNTVMNSAIGQISYQAAYADMQSSTSADALIGPLNAWAGETAGYRFTRLCTEQGYACRILGAPAATPAMGPQTPQTFVQLLTDVEAVDHGMLFEPRGSLALAYRTSASLATQGKALNGTSPLQLAFANDDLGGADLGVADDDQLTLNDETVTRGSGSVSGSSFEATAQADEWSATSSLSVQEPPAGVGPYQDSQTVNVWLDSQLNDQAGWLVHMGTVDEPRYPVLPVDLADTALSSIFYSVLGIDCGDFVQVTDPPPWLGTGLISVLAWGLSEQLGDKVCRVSWAARPESPWEVLMAGTGALTDQRYDSGGSTVHAGFSATAGSFQVDTSPGSRLWTTNSGDFPFYVVIAGEKLQVTSITGTSSPQTFITAPRGLGVPAKAHQTGEPVRIYQPCYYGVA